MDNNRPGFVQNANLTLFKMSGFKIKHQTALNDDRHVYKKKHRFVL